MTGRRCALLLAMPLVAALLSTGCGGSGDGTAGPQAVVHDVAGTNVKRVVLTAEAARRLGIRTAAVRRARAARSVIPYDAVLYGPTGTTFTYTSPRPLVYQRARIVVVRFEGSSAILKTGPPVGTRVVTVGAAELLGVEYGITED